MKRGLCALCALVLAAGAAAGLTGASFAGGVGAGLEGAAACFVELSDGRALLGSSSTGPGFEGCSNTGPGFTGSGVCTTCELLERPQPILNQSVVRFERGFLWDWVSQHFRGLGNFQYKKQLHNANS